MPSITAWISAAEAPAFVDVASGPWQEGSSAHTESARPAQRCSVRRKLLRRQRSGDQCHLVSVRTGGFSVPMPPVLPLMAAWTSAAEAPAFAELARGL